MNDYDEYIQTLKEKTAAETAAAEATRRLAEEQGRLAELEARRVKAEQTRLQMMTEIAATAVNSYEVVKGMDARLAAMEHEVRGFGLRIDGIIEGVKDRLDAINFTLDEYERVLWRLAGVNRGEIDQELDRRKSLRNQLAQHRRNLAYLKEQQAAQGLFVEVRLANEIAYIEGQIAELEIQLE